MPEQVTRPPRRPRRGRKAKRAPIPPPEMIVRVGAPAGADHQTLRQYFDRSGRHRKRAITDLLPEGSTLDGRRVLDFGCGPGRVLRHFLNDADKTEVWGCDPHPPSIEWVTRNLSPPISAYVSEDPPLPHPDAYFDVVYAISVFTHITGAWSSWLAEVHRILKPGGLLISTFLGPPTWEEIAGRSLEEDRLGIAFLAQHQGLANTSGPNVLHSRWWLREHWGRAFEIVTLKPDGFVTAGEGHGVVVGRKRDVTVTADLLEAPGADPREAGSRLLQTELAGLEAAPAGAPQPPRSPVAEGRQPGRRERAERPVASTPARSRQTSLEPILVDHTGRDGSTLMMRLLLTSPEVAVEPPYPYEKKYFAYLLRWARLLDREDWQGAHWSAESLGSLVQERQNPMIGPPPWPERRSFEPPEGKLDFGERAFALVWKEFSRRAIVATRSLHEGAKADARFYAEKHLQTWKLDRAEMPDFRTIVLLRDPRDVYLSIRAFNDKRSGAPLIGQRRDEPREAWRERFIRLQKERLQWIHRLLAAGERPDAIVIRYEDLVTSLQAQASRLGRLLSVEFDPDAVDADVKLRIEHGTSASPGASIGRWQSELDREEADLFRSRLGQELEAVGLET